MKLTKKEINQISEFYNLGDIKNIKTVSGGWVNHNFSFITSKGSFIIRVLGKKLNKWKKDQLNFEFKILKHLENNNFPYKIPLPLQNIKGKNVLKIKDKAIWAYKKINGKIIENTTNLQLKEMAIALATYHKHIKNFKLTSKVERDTIKGLKTRFVSMGKIKPKNKLDRLMLENLELIQNLLKKVEDKKFAQHMLPIHYDFHNKNVLYSKNKLTGILDFENVRIAPRIRDIAYLIKTTVAYGKNKFSKRMKFIINEYEKVTPLTMKEKKDIIFILARDACIMFDFFYPKKEKTFKIVPEGDYLCFKWTIDVAKEINSVFNNITQN